MRIRQSFSILTLAALLAACGGAGQPEPDQLTTESRVTATAVADFGNSATYTVGAWQVTVHDLGLLPGGTTSSARAINNTGRVVGMANDSTFALQRVVWDLNAAKIVTTLPNFDLSSVAEPASINDFNEVAGTERISSTLREGVFWDAFGTVYGLTPFGAGSSVQVTGRAINRDGYIVGSSIAGSPDNRLHAVMWLKNSAPVSLGFLSNGAGAEALAINDLRHVVGVASVNSLTRAFLWRGDKMIDLGAIGGSNVVARASAISNRGVIAGTSDGGTIAVRWLYDPANPSSTPKIEALPLPSGLVLPSPAAVNDNGDVVGTATLSSYAGTRAVLWRNGEAINLGTWPGGWSSRALGINNAGQIVGDGDLYGDGKPHALLWTVTAASGGSAPGPSPSPSPTPTPSSNTSPSVSLSAASSTSFKLGGTLQVSGNFADPDSGPWSYSFDWGDGTTTTGAVASAGQIAASHTYTTLSPKRGFKVTLTVRDALGASGQSGTLNVRVQK